MTQGIASLIETYLWSIIELIILFPVSVFLAFQAHWIVGWCIVGWILFMIPINTFFIRRKRRYSIAHAQSGSELSGQAVDVVTNMSSVRQYVSRMRELLHIGTYIEKNRLANLKNWRASEWMLVTTDVVQSLLLIGLLAFSAHLWKV